MRVAKAKLFHGNDCLTLSAIDLGATKASFDAPREVVARFVRLTFKLSGTWFDVEGVVLPRCLHGQEARCEMVFTTLSPTTVRQIEESLAASAHPAAADRKKPRVATPLPPAA